MQRRWSISGGDISILSGTSLIRHCQPHFHETYVIAYVRQGDAMIHLGGRSQCYRTGDVFVANPYEIVSGGALGEVFEYSACYPCRDFMADVFGLSSGSRDSLPRLRVDAINPEQIQSLSEILAAFGSISSSRANPAPQRPEQELVEFLRRYSFIIEDETLTRSDLSWVRGIGEMIEASLDRHISISDLANHFACDRSYLTRVFRRATGLPPSSYIRQLRLARALKCLREGEPIADTAYRCGFADQAHLTREFKIVYGTTPGQFTRDIA